MGQEGRAGSWQPLAKGSGEWLPQEPRAGTQGPVGSQARQAQPWAGASPAQQERGEMRFGPQNHAWDKEEVEEALECEWSLWEVPGAFSVPGQGHRCLGLPLSQVGQEGTAWAQQDSAVPVLDAQGTGRAQELPARAGCSPLGFPWGSMPVGPNLALFSVHCGSAL